MDAEGRGGVRRKLRLDDVVSFFAYLPACLIGIEACATGHHWARVLIGLDHKIRLMPASYVKPYVKICSPDHNFTNRQVTTMRRSAV